MKYLSFISIKSPWVIVHLVSEQLRKSITENGSIN